MKGLIPHPWLSLVLLLLWLLLAQSAAPGQLLLGLLFGVLIPRFTRDFWPERPRPRRPGLLLRYAGRLLADILLANLQVARLILGPARRLRPAFIELPLRLTDPFAVTLLAGTISLTPGTVSARISQDGRVLLIHCLDLADADALRARLRERYEAPLVEIFGGGGASR